MERAPPYDEDSEQHDEKLKISIESINKIIQPQIDTSIEGIHWVADVRADDDKLRQTWEDAVNNPEPFPPFDDSYNNDYYFDDDEETQLQKLPEVPRLTELDDREERRNELKEDYDMLKKEHDEKFNKQSSSKKDQQKKRYSRDQESTESSSADSISESSSADISDNTSDVTDSDDTTSTTTASDSEEEPAKKQKSEKPTTSNEHIITHKEFLQMVIPGSQIRYFKQNDWKKYVKPISFFFIVVKNDDNELALGKVVPQTNRADPIPYDDLITQQREDADLDKITDEEVSEELFSKIHRDQLITTDREISRLLPKFKKLPKPPNTTLDPVTEKRYRLALEGNIPISRVKFELHNKLTELQSTLPNEDSDEDIDGDDYDDRNSETVKEMRILVNRIREYIKNLEDKEEQKLQQEEEKKEQQIIKSTRQNPEKHLIEQLSIRQKKVNIQEATEEPQQLDANQRSNQLAEMFKDDSDDDDDDSESELLD